ncbi:MAG: phage minor capsid protein [Flavonifractor plautii]
MRRSCASSLRRPAGKPGQRPGGLPREACSLRLNTSQELQQVLSAGLRQTQGLFTNLTRTTALDSGERFRAVLDRAWLQVSTGGFDANTAIRNAIKELTRQGLTTVDYASGRTLSVEAAVRMNVVTGINQTALRLQDTLADEMDSDLVETTAHSGARPSHARWQGQVFSRSGKSKKFPDFRRATGYGTGPGLGGWNCRHSFHPYFEGMASTYGAKELKKLEAKSITYNGEKLTEYEASQRQRYIERQIRRWKREQQAMKAAGQPQEEARAKLKEWRALQTDLVEQTGLKRQYDRERAGG